MKAFVSELDDYPGEFSLPKPFLDRHMRAWWDAAIKPLEGMSSLDYERYDAEWKAAIALITQYGEWKVSGVAVGDLMTDSVPMAVKRWVMKEVESYVVPFLTPPMLRRVAATF